MARLVTLSQHHPHTLHMWISMRRLVDNRSKVFAGMVGTKGITSTDPISIAWVASTTTSIFSLSVVVWGRSNETSSP